MADRGFEPVASWSWVHCQWLAPLGHSNSTMELCYAMIATLCVVFRGGNQPKQKKKINQCHYVWCGTNGVTFHLSLGDGGEDAVSPSGTFWKVTLKSVQICCMHFPAKHSYADESVFWIWNRSGVFPGVETICHVEYEPQALLVSQQIRPGQWSPLSFASAVD